MSADDFLKAFQDLIAARYDGRVASSSEESTSRDWTATELLLAGLDQRLARLEWLQNGSRGPVPKPTVDVADRLRRLGLLRPEGDDGAAGVLA